MALCIASKGYSVYGYDINQKVISSFLNNKIPFYEPNLSSYLKKFKNNTYFSNDIDKIFSNTDVTFLVVPTPSNRNTNFFSLNYIEKFLEHSALSIKNKKKYHLFVITSTVLPGDTRKLIQKFEKLTNKICGKDFGFCYSPEFIALGSVIKNFLNPDFHLLGEYDKKSGDILSKVFKKITHKVPIKRMSIESAELVKISLNSYVTLKISFANLISDYSSKIKNSNALDVTNAMGLDKRIGQKYLNPGLGLGGLVFQEITKRYIL